MPSFTRAERISDVLQDASREAPTCGRFEVGHEFGNGATALGDDDRCFGFGHLVQGFQTGSSAFLVGENSMKNSLRTTEIVLLSGSRNPA